MPLVYGCVARGNAVLAEHAPSLGANFKQHVQGFLDKFTDPRDKFTVTSENYTFNFSVVNGYIYVAVADEAYGREIPYAFLERITQEFNNKYADGARTAVAYSLNRTFGSRIKHHFEYCAAHPEEVSKVAAVQDKVNTVKGIMAQNIEKVLERGEKLEVMVDKASALEMEADKFRVGGRQLRRQWWWQNMKMKLLVLFLILVAIGIIVLIFCVTTLLCRS